MILAKIDGKWRHRKEKSQEIYEIDEYVGRKQGSDRVWAWETEKEREKWRWPF